MSQTQAPPESPSRHRMGDRIWCTSMPLIPLCSRAQYVYPSQIHHPPLPCYTPPYSPPCWSYLLQRVLHGTNEKVSAFSQVCLSFCCKTLYSGFATVRNHVHWQNKYFTDVPLLVLRPSSPSIFQKLNS